jgi:hypothetical protein
VARELPAGGIVVVSERIERSITLRPIHVGDKGFGEFSFADGDGLRAHFGRDRRPDRLYPDPVQV